MGRKKQNIWSIDDYSEEVITIRNKIITELYNTNFIQNYTRQIWEFETEEDYLDTIQFMFEFMLQIEPKRLISFYKKEGINGVRRFAAGLIVRNLRSETSPLYYKLFKNRKNEITFDNNINYDYDDDF